MCATDEYEITPKHIRNARHGYYASLSYIDDKIGQIIQSLKDTHQYENTIIIFTSDHGDMLGERGLWYKMSMFDGSARIPFIVHAPAFFKKNNIREIVSLVDLFPTLLELAGSQAESDGHSLLPLLKGKTDNAKNQAFIEYLAEGVTRPHIMIRQGNYKYIYTEGDPELLFDMDSDPHEIKNLASNANMQETLESFHKTLKQNWDLEKLRLMLLPISNSVMWLPRR